MKLKEKNSICSLGIGINSRLLASERMDLGLIPLGSSQFGTPLLFSAVELPDETVCSENGLTVSVFFFNGFGLQRQETENDFFLAFGVFGSPNSDPHRTKKKTKEMGGPHLGLMFFFQKDSRP